MRVLILGGEGQLGKCIQQQLPSTYDIISPPHSELDITDTVGILRLGPDIIINCAASHDTTQPNAYTMSSVNSTPLIPLVNSISKKTLLVYISTDHVFSKGGIYKESDAPTSSSIYGWTKMIGESIVRMHPRHIILRVSALYSPFQLRGKPRPSFVDQVLNFESDIVTMSDTTMSVSDAVGCTPSYCPDVADMLVELLEDGFNGTLHLVPEDMRYPFSFADFADLIVGESNKPLIISRYGDRNGIVNLSTEYKYSMPSLENSLRRYLGDLSRLSEK